MSDADIESRKITSCCGTFVNRCGVGTLVNHFANTTTKMVDSSSKTVD